MADFKKLLDLRTEKTKRQLGSKSKICLLNSAEIFKRLYNENVIILTCNTRIKHTIGGIMRACDDLDAIVGFELARSECNLEGGYTGFTPKLFVETILEIAEKINFTHPFFIHADHTTIKDSSEQQLGYAKKLIAECLEAGYTSFSIDASFNELKDNIKITTEAAEPIIKQGLGLEVEVGEIKGAGAEAKLTEISEAREFILSLFENKINPNLLAINNGSKHGNYLPGEEVHIDLKRTKEVFDAISTYKVGIAQHGITGTPLNLVGQFADYGIRKGNVGTQWQNVAFEAFPKDLMDEMKKWASGNNKDIKFSLKIFKNKMDGLPSVDINRIQTNAYKTAIEFIKAFRAENSASKLMKKI